MKGLGCFEQIKHGQVLGLSVLAMAFHLGASNAMAFIVDRRQAIAAFDLISAAF